MSFRVFFEPRDLWVGVYWTLAYPVAQLHPARELRIYICLVPMVPLRITIPWMDREG